MLVIVQLVLGFAALLFQYFLWGLSSVSITPLIAVYASRRGVGIYTVLSFVVLSLLFDSHWGVLFGTHLILFGGMLFMESVIRSVVPLDSLLNQIGFYIVLMTFFSLLTKLSLYIQTRSLDSFTVSELLESSFLSGTVSTILVLAVMRLSASVFSENDGFKL